MVKSIGNWIINSLKRLGFSVRMFVCLIFLFNKVILRPRLLIKQLYFIGNYSLIIITICGLFVGFVLTLQSYYILVLYGVEQALGKLTSLSLVYELGPVISGLIFAGRVGTSLTAEIGLMKANEQILAMEMMAINPYQYILVPRFIAGIITMPLLTAIFNMCGILGSYIMGVLWFSINSSSWWSQIHSNSNLLNSIGNGMLKSLIFGIFITFIALYQGYEAHPTPEGVSKAITYTVVYAFLSILGLDCLMTTLMFSN